MIDFYEYLSRVQAVLADPTKMMAKLGIDPQGPHEIEVQKIVKRWKKRPASPVNDPLGTANPAPQPIGK